MKRQDLKKLSLPDKPGVYFFLGPKPSGRARKILYIGKATSLRSRVRSYFNGDIGSTRGPGIAKMIEESKNVKVEVTDSVLEALILEANLIKKHQPKYNAKEKSDKSFNYIVITKEDFPRVLLVRERELLGPPRSKLNVEYALGPFPQGSVLRDALKIVRKIFPFRDKCLPYKSKMQFDGGRISVKKTKNSKPCFNRQINLCPGVCSGEITKTEYRKIISNLKLFFDGKKKQLVKKLEREMKVAAKKQEFEKAAKLKKTIFALKHIQDVSLIKSTSKSYPHQGQPLVGLVRIEGYDVAHISGTSMVGVMTVVLSGEADKGSYRKFKIKTVSGADDTASLEEVLKRRFSHPEWEYPRLIVIDGGKAQKNRAEKVLRDFGIEIPVVSVVKDERHRPKDILGLKTFLKNVSSEHLIKEGVLGEKKYAQKYEKEILLVNNEAHRFALKYHRELRSRSIKR